MEVKVKNLKMRMVSSEESSWPLCIALVLKIFLLFWLNSDFLDLSPHFSVSPQSYQYHRLPVTNKLGGTTLVSSGKGRSIGSFSVKGFSSNSLYLSLPFFHY